MIVRRASKPIHIGEVVVGGDAPIVVQSMTTTDTRDAEATTSQIRRMEEAGCELVRVAVPDREAAEAISEILKGISIPLIADIHFDFRLALAALEMGAHGLRLNPGNIRDHEHIRQVVLAAKERQVPIRIGVNAGSLPQDGSQVSLPERMVEAALTQIHLLESLDFDLIKVSLKAFDILTTVKAYRLAASQMPYPLHLGITEAGTPRAGSIRSAIGLGILLFEGIGDTIRVSLTGDPVEEIWVAYEILKSLKLRRKGVTLISCPSCGRTEINLIDLANAVEQRLSDLPCPLTVAVMGCVVNGPGEAREADVGVAGGKGKGVIFRQGKTVRIVPEAQLLEALLEETRAVVEEIEGTED